MAVTHTTAVRNGLADYVGDAHEVGSSGPATLEFLDGATVIVTFDLGNTPFGAASAAVIALGGVPIDAVAADDGEVDNFVTRNRAGTQILAGSITSVGMGGDIEVTNTNIATGQDCSLESLTYTASP